MTNLILRSDKGNELTHGEMDSNWDWLDKRFWITETVPTVNDDVVAGFKPNHIWVNLLTNSFFKCVSNGAGVAVWEKMQIVAPSPTSFLDLVDTPATLTAGKWLRINDAGDALIETDAPISSGGITGGNIEVESHVQLFGYEENDIKLTVLPLNEYWTYEDLISGRTHFVVRRDNTPFNNITAGMLRSMECYDHATLTLKGTVPLSSDSVYTGVHFFDDNYFVVGLYSDDGGVTNYYKAYDAQNGMAFVCNIPFINPTSVTLHNGKHYATDDLEVIHIFDIATGVESATLSPLSPAEITDNFLVISMTVTDSFIVVRVRKYISVGVYTWYTRIFNTTTLALIDDNTILSEHTAPRAVENGTYFVTNQSTNINVYDLNLTFIQTLEKPLSISTEYETDLYISGSTIMVIYDDTVVSYTEVGNKFELSASQTIVGKDFTMGVDGGNMCCRTVVESRTWVADGQLHDVWGVTYFDAFYPRYMLEGKPDIVPEIPQFGAYSFNSATNLSLFWNGTEWYSPIPIMKFSELDDTPISYVGSAGLLVGVNAGEDGIGYYDLATLGALTKTIGDDASVFEGKTQTTTQSFSVFGNTVALNSKYVFATALYRTDELSVVINTGSIEVFDLDGVFQYAIDGATTTNAKTLAVAEDYLVWATPTQDNLGVVEVRAIDGTILTTLVNSVGGTYFGCATRIHGDEILVKTSAGVELFAYDGTSKKTIVITSDIAKDAGIFINDDVIIVPNGSKRYVNVYNNDGVYGLRGIITNNNDWGYTISTLNKSIVATAEYIFVSDSVLDGDVTGVAGTGHIAVYDINTLAFVTRLFPPAGSSAYGETMVVNNGNVYAYTSNGVARITPSLEIDKLVPILTGSTLSNIGCIQLAVSDTHVATGQPTIPATQKGSFSLYAWEDFINSDKLGNHRLKDFVLKGDLTGSIRPSTSQIGLMFFDSALGIPIWYNGTNWVNSAGTVV